MQRVLLISLYDEYCLGLRYTSSQLRRDGHTVQVVLIKGLQYLGLPLDCSEEGGYTGVRTQVTPTEYSLFMDTVNDFRPGLVCIFFASPCYGLARFLTQRIREKQQTFVLWAGTDSTFSPENNIQHADAICIGEPEYPIRLLAERIENKEECTNVSGIWFNRNGTIHRNPAIDLETNLDSFPWPDFDSLNIIAIANNRLLHEPCPPTSSLRTNAILIASRSCPITCPLCQSGHDGITYKERKAVRLRSVNDIIAELKYRLQTWPYPVERVEFHDDSIPLDTAWLEELAERYPTEIALPFFGYIRPNSTGADSYRLLRQAGAFAMILRIPTSLSKRADTNCSRERIIQTAHAIHDSGIRLLCEFVINNPLEEEKDFIDTLHILREFPDHFGAVPSVPFSYYENCSFHQTVVQKNLANQFERIQGEHALAGKKQGRYLFWESLYKLAQYKGIDRECLLQFVQDEYMREHPETLEEIVDNLYRTTYVSSNPMAEKDSYVQYLRGRLLETRRMASQPTVRKVRDIVRIFTNK